MQLRTVEEYVEQNGLGNFFSVPAEEKLEEKTTEASEKAKEIYDRTNEIRRLADLAARKIRFAPTAKK